MATIDFSIKTADFISRMLFYVAGARQGATFRRNVLNMIATPAPTTESNPPDGILTYDVSIPSVLDEKITVMARVFEPSTVTDEKLPLIVYFHGGGFVIGSGRTAPLDKAFRNLVRDTNSILVTVDYRLAPEDPFPSAIHDAYNTFVWLSSLAQQNTSFMQHVDTNKIIVMGESSGASLVYALTFVLRDKMLPKRNDDGSIEYITVDEIPLKIAHQLLVYPSAHLEDTPSRETYANGYMLSKSRSEFFWSCYTAGIPYDEKSFKSNPFFYPLMGYPLENLPPAIFITGTYDSLHDDGVRMAEHYRNAGNKVWHKNFDSVHGFFFWPNLPESIEAIKYVQNIWREEQIIK
jgi:acetyl esterase